jgi:hypothetical protein
MSATSRSAWRPDRRSRSDTPAQCGVAAMTSPAKHSVSPRKHVLQPHSGAALDAQSTTSHARCGSAVVAAPATRTCQLRAGSPGKSTRRDNALSATQRLPRPAADASSARSRSAAPSKYT